MPPLKILHVEDEPDIREIVAMAFAADSSIEHCTASSGIEALNALAAGEKPDVILLDVVMPQMDGPSTLARIRTMPSHAQTPVIFMTARTQPQEKSRYLALGAIGVISKPFDPLTLGQQIRNILAEVRDESDELANLRVRFRERIALQAAQLREYVANGDLGAPGIERLAHTIAGTGAMLGFGELAVTAAAIDDLYAVGKTPTREALETLALAMEALADGD